MHLMDTAVIGLTKRPVVKQVARSVCDTSNVLLCLSDLYMACSGHKDGITVWAAEKGIDREQRGERPNLSCLN